MSNINKDIAFKNYLQKWGLNKYRFFCTDNVDRLWVYDAATISSGTTYACVRSFYEIRTVETLIRRSKHVTRIALCADANKLLMEFKSFDELKQFSLIEKLGMLS